MEGDVNLDFWKCGDRASLPSSNSFGGRPGDDIRVLFPVRLHMYFALLSLPDTYHEK